MNETLKYLLDDIKDGWITGTPSKKFAMIIVYTVLFLLVLSLVTVIISAFINYPSSILIVGIIALIIWAFFKVIVL